MHDIVIKIDADRRAAAPRNIGIICDNSDVRITFVIDTSSGFNTAEPIFAIFVTDRGELPAVSFTGGSVIAPVFGAEDGAYVRIGLCQGEIKTSSPATLHLLGSAHSVAHGASADPHADEYARMIDELTEDDKILVERASDGYRGAALISALAELIGGGGAAEFVMVAYGDATPGLYASLTAAFEEDKLIVLLKDGAISTSLKAANDALTWSVPWADSIGVWRYSLTSEGVWSTASEAGVRLYQGTQQGNKYMAVSSVTGTVGPTAPDTEPTENSQKLITSGGAFAALGQKVTKEPGKGLSTNDFDAAAKAKVDAIPANPLIVIATDAAVTQALDAGKIYRFTGDLTSLNITLNAPASGQLPQYHFIFTAGTTAPTVTLPNSVQMPDDWAVETNTRYEIDILDGYGLASSWEVVQK